MIQHIRPAVVMMVLFTLLLGLAYPLAMTGIVGVVLPFQAGGSLVKDGAGQVIGSQLLAQGFAKPQYLHPRPSAAGNGYDPMNSGGSNLGPLDKKLIDRVAGDAATIAKEAPGVPIPADAVTTSASGLDPDVSPQNAQRQASRIAASRGVPAARIVALIADQTQGPVLGFIGQPQGQCAGGQSRPRRAVSGGPTWDLDDLRRAVPPRPGRTAGGRQAAGARTAEGLPRHGAGGRQDVRDALATASGARADGVDVVVGVVETHGRKETQDLLDGLEVLPRHPVQYRDHQLMEFDIDGALARRPRLLLVDEYAHSNAPGSRHLKRWQDVEETAGGRDRRVDDLECPAPGEPGRRRLEDHRRARTRDRARWRARGAPMRSNWST